MFRNFGFSRCLINFPSVRTDEKKCEYSSESFLADGGGPAPRCASRIGAVTLVQRLHECRLTHIFLFWMELWNFWYNSRPSSILTDTNLREKPPLVPRRISKLFGLPQSADRTWEGVCLRQIETCFFHVAFRVIYLEYVNKRLTRIRINIHINLVYFFCPLPPFHCL